MHEQQERCPVCAGAVLLVWDEDGRRVWVHEVWRSCSCPVQVVDGRLEVVDDAVPLGHRANVQGES
jgi:hypothetical protein